MTDQLTNLIVKVNSPYPVCVDGRAAYAFASRDDQGRWLLDKKSDQAEAENGPQFLGASLLFVAALQTLGGVEDLDEAMELTQQASRAVGLELQVHIDDLHGQIQPEKMTDQELVQAMVENNIGCGFSKYHWKDQGTTVIQAAKDRGWRVQLLVGEHQEDGAISNYQSDTTFDVAEGVAQGKARFNQDVWQARQVFDKLGELIDQPDFGQKAEDWMIETYGDVVVALKGVSSSDQIVQLGQ
ncbi:MAG: hypothetical protein GF381_04305 [Candidatus Pacebacteria bacterium]|nr:hypothetical protein [Candidatus Paceibacterota bacterium]